MALRSFSIRFRLLSVVGIMLASAGLASAHSELIRSDPAAGATLATAPQQVTIQFSQLLDPAQSSITVVDAAGTTVSNGKAEVPANNGKALRVALKPNLGPGVYTVQWKNFSLEDGEAFKDSFTFTVGSGSSVGTTPSTTNSGGSAPAAQLPATGTVALAPQRALLGLLALALVVAGVMIRVRRYAVPAQRREK